MSDEQSQREQPSQVELKDVRPGRVGLRKPAIDTLDGHPTLPITPNQITMTAPPRVFPPDAYRRTMPRAPAPPPLGWESYAEWRKGKCPTAEYRIGVSLEEYDQAVHEAVGEAAELASLVLENGPAGVFDKDLHDKVVGELGDCLFTFMWLSAVLGDGFGLTGPIEDLMQPEVRKKYSELASTVASKGDPETLANPTPDTPRDITDAYHVWQMEVMPAVLYMVGRIGFFPNAFKKLKWQNVAVPKTLLSEHLFYAFVGLDAVAALHGTSLRFLAQSNMDKINKRFPDGWRPGGGSR